MKINGARIFKLQRSNSRLRQGRQEEIGKGELRKRTWESQRRRARLKGFVIVLGRERERGLCVVWLWERGNAVGRKKRKDPRRQRECNANTINYQTVPNAMLFFHSLLCYCQIANWHLASIHNPHTPLSFLLFLSILLLFHKPKKLSSPSTIFSLLYKIIYMQCS